MQVTSRLALILGCAVVSATEVTPVQKVIQLLEGMSAKGKAEKHDEQVQFAAYKQFCDDTTVEKKRAIAEANEKIDMLNAADGAQLAFGRSWNLVQQGKTRAGAVRSPSDA